MKKQKKKLQPQSKVMYFIVVGIGVMIFLGLFIKIGYLAYTGQDISIMQHHFERPFSDGEIVVKRTDDIANYVWAISSYVIYFMTFLLIAWLQYRNMYKK